MVIAVKTSCRRKCARDRCSFSDMPEVPFIDSNGETVHYDRRITPDRRLNLIKVAWHRVWDNEVA